MSTRIYIARATETDRDEIYALRHEVYARELGQHPDNAEGSIRDALDDTNLYIVAAIDGALAGFVSLTPPGGAYSLDKYLRRDEIPFALDGDTWEVRILTVRPRHRGTLAPLLLMYAALRWVEAHGGTRIVAAGRREVRGLYAKAGLRAFGEEFLSGSVAYVLMSERVGAVREQVARLDHVLARMEEAAQWDLAIPFHKPADCFHGGAFFQAVGDEFDRLERSASIINADVLDAWFPPSPRVLLALHDHLPWLLRTSPPTGCEGMVRTIARMRGVPARCVLPGAGSSSLIFLALREWLSRSSRVLLPEPAYGEYAHVLEKVIRCRVERLILSREHDYDLDPGLINPKPYDLIVLVNPNSPTGRHVPRRELESFLRSVPPSTLVWIDETYVDYVSAGESLEEFAVTRPNVVICKSMSKVYALSGARCAYLCASPHLLEHLRAITPPWAVSLPGQVAAVAALQDRRYYIERYRETATLRADLAEKLSALGLDVLRGTANFLLCHLPDDGPSAAEIVSECHAHNLYIRDASSMGRSLGSHVIRIAVKNRDTNERMIEILSQVWSAAAEPPLCDAAAELWRPVATPPA